MNRIRKLFISDGYTVLPQILSDSGIREVVRNLEDVSLKKAGTRTLLSYEWCVQLANNLKENPQITRLLPENPVAVQCTYFNKSKDRNWLVALHRDQSIPVKSQIKSPDWSAWSKKEGTLYAHPPEQLLRQIVAVRIHLEDNTEFNSPLHVIPGSHKSGKSPQERKICLVPKGGALVMRPLLLHASSKLISGQRRVLHFLFGPKPLPDQAKWAIAV